MPNPDIPGTMLIPLTKGYSAIIDEIYASAVSAYNWMAATAPHHRTVYAVTHDYGRGARAIHLHHFIWKLCGLPSVAQLDHENTNGLDCRRSNLRPATSGQNRCNIDKPRNNTSGFKGVSWFVRDSKWKAQIQANGVNRSLGYFATKEEAHAVYLAAARELHGAFARG